MYRHCRPGASHNCEFRSVQCFLGPKYAQACYRSSPCDVSKDMDRLASSRALTAHYELTRRMPGAIFLLDASAEVANILRLTHVSRWAQHVRRAFVYSAPVRRPCTGQQRLTAEQ
jgi:hypothetical protein